MLRVVLAEDAVLLRAGLAELLHRGGHVVVEAVGDGTGLARAVDDHRPDVVITDVRMPPGFRDEGLRAALELRARHRSLPVLVLSQYVATAYATQLLSGGGPGDGGLGYLLKDRVGEVAEFMDAVRRVAGGQTVIDPEVVRVLLAQQTAEKPLSRLTPREREVLTLMAEGLNNQSIARRLTVTEASVVKHSGNIFMKLDVDPTEGNRRVLAVLAHLRGEEA
ncbi:DNA-binding response regulator [Streptomyces triticagri]|uniref:DNA-binding response regulator n=1 Tax=Streptomyces triticagri TaxID=2293568 RepID=A0A372M1J5_9ACTN|nr:response regulator transcription factor [Streptomyces triticagri]RFU84375.1 DNA-binding response regulator [Streptomyces triticagri]